MYISTLLQNEETLRSEGKGLWLCCRNAYVTEMHINVLYVIIVSFWMAPNTPIQGRSDAHAFYTAMHNWVLWCTALKTNAAYPFLGLFLWHKKHVRATQRNICPVIYISVSRAYSACIHFPVFLFIFQSKNIFSMYRKYYRCVWNAVSCEKHQKQYNVNLFICKLLVSSILH